MIALAAPQDLVDANFPAPSPRLRALGSMPPSGGADPELSVSPRLIEYLTRTPTGQALRRPLKIELTPGEDFRWLACAPQLEVSGTGATIEAAAWDLLSSARFVFEELSSTEPTELDPSASRLLSRLRAILG